ncbi:MAG TPA: glycosyltransferase family 4 protein [Blastocatellia bacterium]|nr:glycosyltransferase family 4 protein [Blastocatellia bacterium]
MSPDDETCGYIRDFAQSLSNEFNVTVLAPPDQNAIAWPTDRFILERSRSILPLRLDPFQAGRDLNKLAEAGIFVRFATLLSLVSFSLRAISLALRADVVCSHWMLPSGLIGALICRFLRKPHIVVEHSGSLHLLAKIPGGKWIARLLIDSSSQVVTVSAHLRKTLIDLSPQARGVIDVIPMGVKPSCLTKPAEINESSLASETVSPFTILFIGRLTRIKGLDVLLRAASGLRNVRVVVGGDGECRHELERLARELSVNASFLGRINASERHVLLSACDVAVIPSRILHDGRTEGTPVVCLEAMAVGRVVIASRVGGLPEVITDKRNGLLFDSEDHQGLREKIQTILEDKDLRRNVEREAPRSCIEYSWERTSKRYAQLIKKALKSNDIIVGRRIEIRSVNH